MLRHAKARELRADLDVFDRDDLTLRSVRMARDLPAGGRRLLQEAQPAGGG